MSVSSEFSIGLNTDDTTGPAATAANFLESLKAKITNATGSLREMERAQRNLKKAGLEGTDQFKQLEEKIGAQKKLVGELVTSQIKLGEGFEKSAKKARGTGKEFSGLEAMVARLPGPLGSVAQKLLAFVNSGAAMKAVLLKVAFVALAVAITDAALSLGKYAIASAEARRNEGIQLEGLTKIRDWYGRAADSGNFLQSTIDGVSSKSALGRAQLVGYTDQLYRMGLRGEKLKTTLEAMSTVAAVQGDAEANRFAAMAAGAAFAGGSVKRLAEDVKARLGGIAARQLLSLDVQMSKLRENFRFLFSGLKLDTMLKGLQEFTSLFSQNTETGKALKIMFEALFQPLIDSMGSTGPLAKRFFQGLVIAGLLFTISLLQIRNTLRDVFGGSSLSDADKMKLALAAGVTIGSLLVAVFTALAIKVAIITAPIWGIALALAAVF